MSAAAVGAPGDPYRYGVYLRPDPHTCLAITTITSQLRAQYGFVSAGAFPPHATLVGSQHITAAPQTVIEALTVALEGVSPFPVHNAGIVSQGIGFVFDVHHEADARIVNEDLMNLASVVDSAVSPLVSPAPNPSPGHAFDPKTFRAHLSLASHDLYRRGDLQTEVGEFILGLPVSWPATFTAEHVALYRTSSADWTGRWWETLRWEHLHTWRL